MRVLRSSLFVAATAIIAAACGDKVNIVQPTTAAGSITSVQVAPSSATISVGQAVQLTAAVNASAGITPTITWSTSSSASATVSQTGLVTGIAASPGVAICAAAASAGVATVTACGTVVVQPAATIVPAVLQIASVTIAGNLNAPVATPPGIMAGQVNVSVNLSPGTEKMDSVVVKLNGVTAATQVFTSAQAAALRAATGSGADQALQSTLVFAVNTAAYATAGCATQIAPCGTPTFLNGAAVFTVIGYGKQGSTPATNSVTSQGYLLGNADAWIVAETLGAGTNTATSAGGFNFSGGNSGSVAVTAVPVAYSGLTIASAKINFGTAACDGSGSAQRTVTAVAPVAPSVAWTGAFTRTAGAAAGATNVNNYEFSPALCAAANAGGGEGAAVASALYTTNVNAPVGFALGSTVPVVRLDDRAPGVPSLVQNPRIRQNGWINAAVGILAVNTGSAGTANNVITAGVPDAGVGGGAYQLRVAATGAGGIVDGALAAAPLTAATAVIGTGALAPTLANTSLCGIWTAIDALGNESALPPAGTVCSPPVLLSNAALAATHQQFGVDIAPPTIAMGAGSIAASTAGAGNTGASVGTEFQVTVLDTGIVGNSGMLAGGPVLGTVTIRTAAVGLTAAQLCPVGTVSGGVCTASATGIAVVAYPNVSTSTIAAQTIIGYYTLTASSVDAAGNVSTNTVSRVVDYNPAANVPALTGSLFNTPLTGPTATFTATGSSGNTTVNGPTTFFDLWKVSYTLGYAGGFAFPLVYPATTINTFNTAPAINSNVPVTISITGFIRQAEAQTSACNAALTTGGAFKPNSLTEALLDMVNNTSGNVVTPIAAGSVAAGVSYLATVPATQQIFSFIDGNGVVEQPTAGGCPIAAGANSAVKVGIGGTSADPTAVTLKADVWGPTATFQPPFAQVNWYVKVGAATLELIGTSNTYSTTDDGSAQGRKHSYTFSWTPGAKTPITGATWAAATYPGQSSAACAAAAAANFQIYAVGVSAAGDALIAPLNANVCQTNAP